MTKLILRLVVLSWFISTVGCAQQNTRSANAQSDNDEKLFLEEAKIIHRWDGEKPGGEFGWVARIVGDVDGDDVLDFVTTAPSFNKGNGKIYVYSGKSAELIFSVEGQNRERLGNGASAAGDVNGDNVPDVLVGAPGSATAYVYSGKSGEELLKINEKELGGQFGYKVCKLGDIDGDGHSDIFVSALSASGSHRNSGVGIAYSGKNGKKLFQLEGERSGDKFGSAVCAATTDEFILLAVGAQDAGKNQSGKVYVYRIETSKPTLAFEITGNTKSVNLGQMFVAFPGDSNGDGVPDVFASDFSDQTAAPGAGKIVVHDGKSGKHLFSITGKQPREGFGTSQSEAGDVNGDGIGDLVIGAWQNRGGAPSGGRVSLHDGRDGTELDSWTCKVAGDTFGFDAVGIGDVDGDGAVDFLLTSAWSNAGGAKTGRVFVIAGKKYAK